MKILLVGLVILVAAVLVRLRAEPEPKRPPRRARPASPEARLWAIFRRLPAGQKATLLVLVFGGLLLLVLGLYAVAVALST